jgi:spore coat polysaccharide biosynthesis predicted glycosyltransferase SpsG
MTRFDAKKLTVSPEVCNKNFSENGGLPPLWIHTGAGPQMGFGHLNRCMILAGELRDDARVCFVLRPEDQWSGGRLEERGLDYQNIDFSRLRLDSAISPAAILIDTRLSDGLDAFIRTARGKDIPIISLHDMGLNPLCSDIAVDGSIAAEARHDLPARRSFTGAAYMILDPALRELRGKHPGVKKEIRSVFVGLGGGDARKYFSLVLEGLRFWAAGTEREIEVVGMRGFVEWGQDDFNKETLNPLRFRWETGAAAGFLRNSDLAVTAGGISAYEALCSGVPLMALSWDSLQQTAIDRIEEAGGCVSLGAGDDLTPEFLAGAIGKIDADAAAREKMIQRGVKIVDGRGAERVAAIIRGAIHREDT